MTKAIQVGLHKQSSSSLDYHAARIAEILKVSDVVPSMTDNEVRYAQGKVAVIEHVQQQSQNQFSEGFNESFIISLCEAFPFPELNWDTPVAHIMYCSGVKYALDAIVRYYNEELGA